MNTGTEFTNTQTSEHRHRIRGSVVLDQRLQAAYGVVPLGGDAIEIASGLLDSPRFELPDAFAAAAPIAHQPGIGQCVQVLGNGLPRDIGAVAKARDRQRTLIAQP